jgi:sporulation protein YlmC with PRC-barrel domain
MQRLATLVTAVVCLAGWIATAQETVKKQETARKVAPEVKQSLRASEMIGLTVKNSANKDLGTVNDIVLDTGEGHIRYIAVSYGGWLGLGDKLFAVPYKSFQWKQDDSRENYLLLNLSEQQLKAAPGFDQNNWPDFANDAQWQQKIDTYYRVERTEVRREAPAR